MKDLTEQLAQLCQSLSEKSARHAERFNAEDCDERPYHAGLSDAYTDAAETLKALLP